MNLENFLTLLLVLFIIGVGIAFRYLQADKSFWCMFDGSPRTCSVLLREYKK